MEDLWDKDPSPPMFGHNCTGLFHLSTSLDQVTQKFIKPSLQYECKDLCKDHKDTKTINNVGFKSFLKFLMMVMIHICEGKKTLLVL